ncbi:hypothetical protein [Collinsella tanakaei]|uniref:hypothetical protein n=1 Tax=Collinsella tanakaei TaxID=626935 RepID=UPI0025A3613F|nr:hypothetical protein [Collinsella tanakaei]MDM8300285.1 hypothetical protein [Collinsella tanakaei]
MNLTFRGFLKLYCQELVEQKTENLKKLAHFALTDAPRVAEPLLLLALERGKADYLRSLVSGSSLSIEYDSACETLEAAGGSLEDALENGAMPRRYQNVWRAYQARKRAVDADRRVNGLMRRKSVEAMERKGITCYRVCKDLGLNKGNVYAYLHGGDDAKVSRETARKIYEYIVA